MLSYYAMGREKKQVIGLNVSPDLSAQQGNGKSHHFTIKKIIYQTGVQWFHACIQ
jgi:hypothetical protein